MRLYDALENRIIRLFEIRIFIIVILFVSYKLLFCFFFLISLSILYNHHYYRLYF